MSEADSCWASLDKVSRRIRSRRPLSRSRTAVIRPAASWAISIATATITAQLETVGTEERLWFGIDLDGGTELPDYALDRVFERFYRVDRARSRETGGTGLGLSIVRRVAANHGGEVLVSSQEGEGSTFVLRLPASLVVPPPERSLIDLHEEQQRRE